MTIRPEVASLALLGPFPAESDESATVERLDRYEAALDRIIPPISDEEAAVLIQLFGPDDCFGGAWVLLHLIETAPSGAPVSQRPDPGANEWLHRLWDRRHRWLPEAGGSS